MYKQIKTLLILVGLFLIPEALSALSISGASISPWAGYNVAKSSVYDTLDSQYNNLNSLATASGYTVSGKGGSKGGLAFGGDLWMKISPKIDIGFGIAYLRFYGIQWGATNTPNSLELSGTIGALPVLAQGKANLFAGLYLGLGLGYALGNGIILQKINETTAQTTSQMNAGALMAMMGYDVVSTASVKVGLEVRFYMVLDSIPLQNILPLAKIEFMF